MGVFEHPEHRWIDATADMASNYCHSDKKWIIVFMFKARTMAAQIDPKIDQVARNVSVLGRNIIIIIMIIMCSLSQRGPLRHSCAMSTKNG